MKKHFKILILGLVLMTLVLGCSREDESTIEALMLSEDGTFLLTKDSGPLKKEDLINLSLPEGEDLSLGHIYKIKIGEDLMESYPYQGQAEEVLEDKGRGQEKISLDTALSIKDFYGTGATIIDVRSLGEFQGGHLSGAINSPLDTIEDEIEEDLDQVIIVYCQSGRRSKAASKILSDLGYKVVLDGGGISSYKGQVEK